MSEVAYLVCVTPRYVFFGYATPEEMEKEKPVLKRVRMLVRWSRATKGVLGAAEKGPQAGSRISDPVPKLTIRGQIEIIIPCSEQAIKIFEEGAWDE